MIGIDMASTLANSGSVIAAKEHLLGGNPLTRMEALVLFGCSNLPEVVFELRRDGYVVNKRNVPYAAAMVRINKHAVLEPPPNLPIREILFTEYWLSR